MFVPVSKLNALMSARERRQLLGLLAMMLFAALLEVVGVSAIPAFVSAVVYPEQFMQLPFVAPVLNALGLNTTWEILAYGSGALVVLFALKNGFLVLNVYCQSRFIANLRINLSRRLVTAYMRAPYTFHLMRNTAELIRNVNGETSQVANQVIEPLLEITTRGLIAVSVLGFLLWVEPWITLGLVPIFGLIAVLGVGALSTRMRRAGLIEQDHRGRVMQALHQGLGSIKEARVLGRESYFIGKVSDSVRDIAQAARFQRFGSKIISPLTEAIAVTGLAAITMVLLFSGRPVEAIPVTLALFVAGLIRLRDSSNVIMSQWANLRYHAVAVEPLHADITMLEAEQRRPEQMRRELQAAEPPRIELSDVWYRYPETEKAALRGVSMSIRAGSTVGFVGGTGAGKSTLIDVILGLLVPDEGRVLVDGHDIHAGALAQWQRGIGYIPQSVYLLDDTLRRNIALGLEDEEVDEVALARAVRASQLSSLVARLPGGLDTFAGERGVRLSGGERQRIGIARALYHDPKVLIMDEPTSALDASTERAVVRALEELGGRCTVLIVAHRLSTVRHCDTLYFVKEGCIEASGSYAELRERSKDFSRMAAE